MENNATYTLEPNVEHYKKCAIQPIDYIIANDLDFLEGNIIKYVTRYKFKGGVADLKKAMDYLNWLTDREEKNEQNKN